MFMGEYRHALDDKGRLFIPARFREELGAPSVVAKGLDGCLFLFPRASWQRLQDDLAHLPLTRSDARAFMRFLLAGAAEVEPDRQGRIGVPTPLREHAALVREAVVVGVGDRVEVWAQDRWEAYSREAAQAFERIAEELASPGVGA